MIKAILFDADGVTLKKKGYISEKLSSEYGTSLEGITSFFKNEYRQAQLDEIDLKNVLPAYLEKWNWTKSIEEFFDYWFKATTVADDDVIFHVQKLRGQGLKCYLVSDQDKYRADYIKNNLYLANKFDKCFFSCDVRYSKSSSQFFRQVLYEINLPAEEVLYFDDESENLDAASNVGIHTKQFKSISDIDSTLTELNQNE